MDEFYRDENQEINIGQVQSVTTTKTKVKPKPNQSEGFVQDIQQGLRGSVRAVN